MPAVIPPLLLAAGLAAGLSVAPVLAHVGHGDEFQQQGDVRQVPSNPDTDALLGVETARPEATPGGLTVPTAAVVDADGKALLFVKSAATYDPVFVTTGATSGDRIVITEGVTAEEDVVIRGALSLYAESKKSQKPGAAASEPSATEPASAAAATEPAKGPLSPVAIGAAAAAVAVAAGVAISRRGRKS